jgi:hypothetical protein
VQIIPGKINDVIDKINHICYYNKKKRGGGKMKKKGKKSDRAENEGTLV